MRLRILLDAYRRHVSKTRKGPANEQAFKEYMRSLPAEDKESLRIPEDIDSLFVSPRDGQPFVIQYNKAISPAGPTIAVAYEKTGVDGKHWVALSLGYVEEYSEQDMAAYKK